MNKNKTPIPIYSWKTKEFLQYNKNKFITLIVPITIFIIGVLIFLQNNGLTGVISLIFFTIFAISIFIFTHKEPSVINIELFDNHLNIDNQTVLYSSIVEFFIDSDYHETVLELIPIQQLSPYLILPLNDEDNAEEIIEFLSNKINLVEPHHRLIERIFEIFHF